MNFYRLLFGKIISHQKDRGATCKDFFALVVDCVVNKKKVNRCYSTECFVEIANPRKRAFKPSCGDFIFNSSRCNNGCSWCHNLSNCWSSSRLQRSRNQNSRVCSANYFHSNDKVVGYRENRAADMVVGMAVDKVAGKRGDSRGKGKSRNSSPMW